MLTIMEKNQSLNELTIQLNHAIQRYRSFTGRVEDPQDRKDRAQTIEQNILVICDPLANNPPESEEELKEALIKACEEIDLLSLMSESEEYLEYYESLVQPLMASEERDQEEIRIGKILQIFKEELNKLKNDMSKSIDESSQHDDSQPDYEDAIAIINKYYDLPFAILEQILSVECPEIFNIYDHIIQDVHCLISESQRANNKELLESWRGMQEELENFINDYSSLTGSPSEKAEALSQNIAQIREKYLLMLHQKSALEEQREPDLFDDSHLDTTGNMLLEADLSFDEFQDIMNNTVLFEEGEILSFDQMSVLSEAFKRREEYLIEALSLDACPERSQETQKLLKRVREALEAFEKEDGNYQYPSIRLSVNELSYVELDAVRKQSCFSQEKKSCAERMCQLIEKQNNNILSMDNPKDILNFAQNALTRSDLFKYQPQLRQMVESLFSHITNNIKEMLNTIDLSDPKRLTLRQEEAIRYLRLLRSFVNRMTQLSDSPIVSMLEVSKEFDMILERQAQKIELVKGPQARSELKKGVATFSMVLKSQSQSYLDSIELARFLESSLGNAALNKQMTQNSLRQLGIDKQYADVFKDIRYWALKSHNPEFYTKSLTKLETLNTRFFQNQTISEEQKLTNKEYQLLKSLKSIDEKILQKFKDTGVIDASPLLKHLSQVAEKAIAALDQFDQHLIARAQLQTGDLILNRFDLIDKVKPERSQIDSWLNRHLISNYQHASHVIIGSDGQPYQSHILSDHQYTKIHSTDLLTSDIYRPLFNQFKTLNAAHIPNATLRQYFEEEFRALHENNQSLKRIQNGFWIRIKAGAAQYGFFGGHKKKTGPNDFNTVHNELSDEQNSKKPMICSEFVARSMGSAIEAVNKRLNTEQQDANPNLPIEYLENPFKDEILENITPGHLKFLLARYTQALPVNRFCHEFIATQNQREPLGLSFEQQMQAALTQALATSTSKDDFVSKALSDFQDCLNKNYPEYAPMLQKADKTALAQLLREFWDKPDPSISFKIIQALAYLVGIELKTEKEKALSTLPAQLLFVKNDKGHQQPSAGSSHRT